MDALLQVKGLEVKYHTREGVLPALRDVSFGVNAGEIVGIVGESGCGKSSVASALLRLLPPNGRITAGQIDFKGRDLCRVTDEEMRQLRGNEISMIFQDPLTSLNPVFTVETQMLDARRAHHRRNEGGDLHQEVVHMLTRVGIPDAEERIKNYPHQFSGGMRQRIMIAMTLLTHPALLVADEPTSALDVTLEAQILDLIRGLREELGTAILYISHDLGVMAQLCDRLVVMYAGNVVETGDVYTIFDSPKHPYTQALLGSHPSRKHAHARLVTIPGQVPSLRQLPQGCKFHPRCRMAQPNCQTVEPRSIKLGAQQVLCHLYDPESAVAMAGAAPAFEPIPQTLPQRTRHAARSLIASPVDAQRAPVRAMGSSSVQDMLVTTRQVRVHFPDDIGLLGQLLGQKGSTVRAVDGVDLEIRRGETLGLVGESGSGKTTLGRALLRLEVPTAGEALVDGAELSRLPESQVRPLRARMQMIFQDPYSSLSPRMRVSALLLEPFRIHGIAVDAGRKVTELLTMVGLSAEQSDKYPHELSGGQARRVGIARALALNPQFLVADEPTAGLDVSVAASILNLLQELKRELHLTYLIITHNLNVISFIADRVGVMYLGKLVELGTTDDIFEHPQHPYTEALISAIAVPDPRLREFQSKRILLKGEIPSPKNPPPGCPFHPRCRYAQARCSGEAPLLKPALEGDHLVACHSPLGTP
jgi:peptide/nickel transport system ATP-binding protein